MIEDLRLFKMNGIGNVGVVIISRQSSKRLPGKALIEINGKPVLKYIIERLETVFNKKSMVIATSLDTSDDAIEEFAHKEGIDCYRGSLENVALRFYEAAAQKGWEYAIRISGDNVFVNLEAIVAMLNELERNDYIFLSNKKDQTFPTGMSVEIVKMDYYQLKLRSICEEDRFKEHVTMYFYERDNPKKHYYYYNTLVPEAAGIELALDTPNDFYKISTIINGFTKPHWDYYLKEIFDIWKKLKQDNLL
ncbi:spore coat polysaccharide biosynthesis protein SpsF [Methanocalculus sp. AMF5]|uniref:cytidylyltransferase domain-containing protein n=1 Tax=Methanocalculus sp. AMF5 TaxID=1198257 RepID=UPI00209FDECC|nr:hypothetical protein [Methanocalculus sp. AMF5]MCP1663261.1 spore coat polysaccharide biosynthesis protein SpsF [Methanocalculus sp. AMF5]